MGAYHQVTERITRIYSLPTIWDYKYKFTKLALWYEDTIEPQIQEPSFGEPTPTCAAQPRLRWG